MLLLLLLRLLVEGVGRKKRIRGPGKVVLGGKGHGVLRGPEGGPAVVVCHEGVLVSRADSVMVTVIASSSTAARRREARVGARLDGSRAGSPTDGQRRVRDARFIEDFACQIGCEVAVVGLSCVVVRKRSVGDLLLKVLLLLLIVEGVVLLWLLLLLLVHGGFGHGLVLGKVRVKVEGSSRGCGGAKDGREHG